MISVEDWAEIRRLHRAEQMPVRAIARQLGISRNTVRRAIADDARRSTSGRRRARSSTSVEPQIRELLQQWPDMPATVIAERIGWDRGLTVLKDRVRELRPAYRACRSGRRGRSMSPASWPSATCGSRRPTSRSAIGQSGRPPVLVMVSGYSR